MVQEVHGEGDEGRNENKRPRRLVAVTVVKSQQETALVEWTDDDIHRVYVPVAAVVNGKVSEEDLAAGVRYGVAWEELIVPTTPETVAKRLRQLDIWTPADARANAPLIKREAVTFDVPALLRDCEEG